MTDNNVPTWIKANLFENILRKVVKDFQKINEFKVFPALAPGENYATLMLKVQTDVLLKTGLTQSQSFMLKVPHNSELYRKGISKWNIFDTELGMYRDIKPEFEKLYADAGLEVRFGPNAYELPIDKEYILLEDLSVKGFRNTKRQNCLDMEQCKGVLKKIAQFHAVSAVRVAQKGMFEKQYLNGFLNIESKDFFKNMLESTFPYVKKTIQNLRKHQEYYGQVEKLAHNLTDFIFEQCTLDDNEFNVLNHGDCWANNIMFQYDDKGKLKETYFVDLQIPRYGTPAQDLLYFIISSAHLDIKIKQFDYMIKFYYDNLIEHLEILKYTKPLPKLRDIHGALIKYGIWGFITLTMVLAAVLADPTEYANLENFVGSSNDSQKFKEMLYSNDRYAQHLEIILPWLFYRGSLQN